VKAITTAALASFALGIYAAEIPKAPVPPSPYLPIMYKYADAMVERGRDTKGLFYSALDRATMAPLTNLPPAPSGVREEHRVGRYDFALVGSNPFHDENLLRLLYTLSELSGKPKYRDAADAELRGVQYDSRYLPDRPWVLLDRGFHVAPDVSRRRAEPRIDDFMLSFARDGGFRIREWAAVYARTNNEDFLDALDRFAGELVARRDPATGMIRTLTPEISHPLALSGLSLAIDCDAASRLVPDPTATRLRSLADEQDRMFCALPHDLKGRGGFITGDAEATGANRNTTLWTPRAGRYRVGHTTAQVAMMCVSRYENTGNIAYRDLIHAAADAYLKSMPAPDDDVWPMTFGHAISLQVAAWRSTAQQKYLDRARELADFAMKHFFDQGPLPRASLKSTHYESITGADTLALGFVELHLHILGITAVRYPPNTIDR